MSLTEILATVILALMVITLGAVVYLILQKGKKTESSDDIERIFSKQTDEMKSAMTKSMFESMLQFNTDVNKQLRESTDVSGKNIAEFRLNVDRSLVEFQAKINQKLETDFKSMNEEVRKNMDLINKKVEDRLKEGFTSTNETFVKIAERVQVIDDAQKKIEGLSTEMISLQNILQNNQARGSFGEYQLNQILFSVYGENQDLYRLQYVLKEEKGTKESVRADAVVFMPEPNKMIAIDSKFPYSKVESLFNNNTLSKEEEEKYLSEFAADVKKRITEISSKYIIPAMTANYAVMFVPSDGILALLHSKLIRVLEYAKEKKVVIVSPTTIVPLLTTFYSVVIDYKRNSEVNLIIDALKKLKKDFRIFGEHWSKLNNNIQSLTKQSNEIDTRYERISNRFKSIEQVEEIGDQDSEE